MLASDNTDVVIDINGYFAPVSSAASGQALFTVTPCRVLDTRDSSGAFNGMRPVNVTGSSCGIPSTAEALVLNATVVPTGGLGYLSLWPDGEAQPGVSTLNAADGVIASNMALVPTTNGSIDAFASNPTQLILDISGYFAPSALSPLNWGHGEIGRDWRRHRRPANVTEFGSSWRRPNSGCHW